MRKLGILSLVSGVLAFASGAGAVIVLHLNVQRSYRISLRYLLHSLDGVFRRGGEWVLVLYGLAVLFGLLAVVLGARQIATRHLDSRGGLVPAMIGMVLPLLAVLPTIGLVVYWVSFLPYPKPVPGRPYRRRGRSLLPRASRKDRSSGLYRRAWFRDAQHEHAAVAAFEQLALDLEVCRAPDELVRRARRASAQEVRHAQVAYELAGGRGRFQPEPFRAPPRKRAEVDMTALAVESLVDGCFNEAVAGRYLSEAATRLPQGDRLWGVSRDEREHAELAWDIVGWCVATGGEPTRRAVRRAANALPRIPGLAPTPHLGLRFGDRARLLSDVRRRVCDRVSALA